MDVKAPASVQIFYDTETQDALEEIVPKFGSKFSCLI